MQKLLALIPLMVCSACGPQIEVGIPRPPEEYLTCKELPAVPPIAPLTPVRAANGMTVYLKTETDARDAEIARWILQVRGAWFSCSNQLERVRDYYSEAE